MSKCKLHKKASWPLIFHVTFVLISASRYGSTNSNRACERVCFCICFSEPWLQATFRRSRPSTEVPSEKRRHVASWSLILVNKNTAQCAAFKLKAFCATALDGNNLSTLWGSVRSAKQSVGPQFEWVMRRDSFVT